MTPAVFLAVLLAAIMHAGWNALIKVRLDRFAAISVMTLGLGVAALPFLPFVAVPEGRTWGFILFSVAMHTGYRTFLVKAYEAGDLAQAYPLARGTAPLLVAGVGAVLLAEVPTPLAGAGIALLCGGTLLMSLRGGRRAAGATVAGEAQHHEGRAVLFALVTSLFVAGYTLSDGQGARSAADAASYAVWLYFVDAIWTTLLCVALRGRAVVRTMLPEWRVALLTGALSGVAYWIAMWAMTRAPIASVAALRETSILWAMLISVAALGERMTAWRVAAAALILGGAALLRLG